MKNFYYENKWKRDGITDTANKPAFCRYTYVEFSAETVGVESCLIVNGKRFYWLFNVSVAAQRGHPMIYAI